MTAGRSADPFSIISLNWDSLIEDSIFWVLRHTNGIRGKRALADVDYCVYTVALDDSPHTASTKQKALNIYNLKLLKMHGSSTWLRCPYSNRIFTGLGIEKSPDKIYIDPILSPFIKERQDHKELNSNPLLEPYIITPTFTKVFDSAHMQDTWHNAYVELREADEVVFVGYSLPDADYHFRTLLRRAVRQETKIEVVLHRSDSPGKGARGALGTISYPKNRYEQVFHDNDMSFKYYGVKGFIDGLSAGRKLSTIMLKLARSFKRM